MATGRAPTRRALCLLAFEGCLLVFGAEGSPHRFDHVVIVIEENHSFTQIIGNTEDAPYINQLADEGANFTNFYAITHPSQPNYLEFFSGNYQGVTDDAYPQSPLPFDTPNLGAEVLAQGFTYASFSESLPAIGDATTTMVPEDGSLPRT